MRENIEATATPTLAEQLGVEYKEVDGPYYPMLAEVDENEFLQLGKWGHRWLGMMMEHDRYLYNLYFMCGDLYQKAKLADDDYYLLTLVALAKECQSGAIPNGARVVLGVGLPLKHFATTRKAFVRYLKREQIVKFNYEDAQYNFTIENVLVFPQCYAAVADKLGDMKGEYLIVDVGSWTIDIMHVKDGVPVESKCETFTESMISVIRGIRSKSSELFGKEISEEVITDFISNGNCSCAEKYTRLMESELERVKNCLVWEKVCAVNFGSVLNKKLHELPLDLSEDYESRKNKKLIDIIDKPQWYKQNPHVSDGKVDTLKPDLICIYPCDDAEYCFGIYDAKYYCIDFKEVNGNYKVTGQPGVGDVTKQYLYQLAYDDFITKQGYKYVQNMFFCPQESAEPDYGYVEMKMLHTIGNKTLENIAVVKLCAEEMYDLYLQNEQITDPTAYIPSVAIKHVYSTNFANRMMAYLKGITKASQEAQIKMEMKSEKGKLIYPRQIKRELGAKLIYDAICPIATGAFYGFNPYEKEYGNMVAEDMGGSYEKCEQIL